MPEHQRHLTQMAIDLKKYRIRVHKDSLHLIGDPDYIQLLVNTDAKQVAIRAVERATAGSHAHKVTRARTKSELSCEIYSRPFIDKLCSDFDFRDGASYRLTGVVIPSEKVAVFPLKTMQLIESEG